MARSGWLDTLKFRQSQPRERPCAMSYVTDSYTAAFKKHPGMSFGYLPREAHLGTLSDAGRKIAPT